MKQKILVGVITFEGEKYIRKAFMQSLQNLSYPSFDVVFADNSGQADADDVRKEATVIKKGKVDVLVTDPSSAKVTEDILAINRNAVRDYFLAGDWTHLVFIDSDVFVPTNTIEVMLSHNKDLVGGVYLNGVQDKDGKKRILPVLFAHNKKGENVRASVIDLLVPRLVKATAAGLGCNLISRKVLEDVSFPSRTETGMVEDIGFFANAAEKGYQLWVDTRIQCPHVKFPVGDERNKLYDLRSYQLQVKKK